MTTVDELNARLFVAKQQLRILEEAIADARTASREVAGEFSPGDYLAIAAELETQATEKREEIAELEHTLRGEA